MRTSRPGWQDRGTSKGWFGTMKRFIESTVEPLVEAALTLAAFAEAIAEYRVPGFVRERETTLQGLDIVTHLLVQTAGTVGGNLMRDFGIEPTDRDADEMFTRCETRAHERVAAAIANARSAQSADESADESLDSLDVDDLLATLGFIEAADEDVPDEER